MSARPRGGQSAMSQSLPVSPQASGARDHTDWSSIRRLRWGASSATSSASSAGTLIERTWRTATISLAELQGDDVAWGDLQRLLVCEAERHGAADKLGDTTVLGPGRLLMSVVELLGAAPPSQYRLTAPTKG